LLGRLVCIDHSGEELIGLAGVAEIEPAVVVLGFKDTDGVDTLRWFFDGGGFGGDELCRDVECCSDA